MLTWLLIIVAAYFFFSLSSLGDKLILAGPPKPKPYTFFVGIVGLSVVVLIPFIDLRFPEEEAVFWIVLEAMLYIAAIYAAFVAVEYFDISKAATAIGAIVPIFVFLLTFLVWGGQTISKTNILAFILLLLGSFIISFERKFKTTGAFLVIVLFASLLSALDYVVTKIIFLQQDFLFAFFWMRIIAALLACLLLLSKKIRKEIFERKTYLNRKVLSLMAFTYTAGGVANLFQAFAIALVPAALLPILNSLRGVQYVFLFLMTLFFSFFLPKILKEEISKKIIIQKIIAIILIVAGLAILVY